MPLPEPLPSVVTLLQSINPIGSSRLVAIVGRLTDREQQALATVVSSVDAHAGGYNLGIVNYVSYWAGPARAWMLYQLNFNQILTSNPPTFDSRSRVIPELVAEVAAMSAQGVLDSLADAMSGKRHIAALHGAQTDRVRRAAMLTWDPNLFTHPDSHQPDGQFVHLVVGLRRETNIGLATAPQARLDYVNLNLAAFIDNGTQNYRSAQHYLHDPGILTKSLISASVLTDRKTKTYAGMHFGFVLRAPMELIGAASSSDMDMGFDKTTRPDMLAIESDQNVRMALITDSFVQGVASLYMRPLPTRDDVVRNTADTGHNEVAVVGSMGGYAVRVSALFVKTSLGKPMLAAEHDVDDRIWNISRELPACADRLGVPLIRIPDANLDAGGTYFHDRY